MWESWKIKSSTSMSIEDAKKMNLDTNQCLNTLTLVEFVNGYSLMKFHDISGRQHCRLFDDDEEEVLYHIY